MRLRKNLKHAVPKGLVFPRNLLFLGNRAEKQISRFARSTVNVHRERQCREMQNQFLNKDVQEWYHSKVWRCQQKKSQRRAHPPRDFLAFEDALKYEAPTT